MEDPVVLEAPPSRDNEPCMLCPPWTERCVHWNGYRLMMCNERLGRVLGVSHIDEGLEWSIQLVEEQNNRPCNASTCLLRGHDFFYRSQIILCSTRGEAERVFDEREQELLHAS